MEMGKTTASVDAAALTNFRAENWFSGACGRSGSYGVLLARHSSEMLEVLPSLVEWDGLAGGNDPVCSAAVPQFEPCSLLLIRA
jgi:hypothetical protein